ncbi:hypothetical protein [Roseomonas sp. AR75]|uniref:hypothetical protein n=1 Tax=Roseomonas sp. AR75 TaxID=2562311 RepID=UPI0010BF932D|nr:hypothetical protein [Roseomonas sp. AR75]
MDEGRDLQRFFCISLAAWPAEHHDVLIHLDLQIRNLTKHCDDYRYAIMLIEKCNAEQDRIVLSKRDLSEKFFVYPGMEISFFEYKRHQERISSEGKSWSAWLHIAARDAAMTVHHFEETLSEISRLARQCQPIWVRVNKAELKEARRRYKESFPSHREVRDALAHRAGATLSPQAIKRHSASKIFITDSIFSSGITFTRNGEVVAVPLNTEAAKQLCEVTTKVYSAFSDVAENNSF